MTLDSSEFILVLLLVNYFRDGFNQGYLKKMLLQSFLAYDKHSDELQEMMRDYLNVSQFADVILMGWEKTRLNFQVIELLYRIILCSVLNDFQAK